jgi:TetR/AcrR family transcriptional regulator, transcriptional repressor for nem operon
MTFGAGGHQPGTGATGQRRLAGECREPAEQDPPAPDQPLDNIPTGLYLKYMASAAASPKAPEATRRRLLEAAFTEFYTHGFQGGSLNHIVDSAGATKGALFHHFDSKQQLGYAVLDDLIGPLLLTRWLDPLADSTDPLRDLQRAFRRHVEADIASGYWLQGCPLNNLAQEMSPLDDGFHQRIHRLYHTWREQFAAALERGMQSGTVRPSISPRNVAALLVAAQMGIWGSGKSSRNTEVMRQATDGVCDYLESLRA